MISKKHFSKLEKFKAKLRASSSSSGKNYPDINQQIQSLDERQVQVTFRDIWLDY